MGDERRTMMLALDVDPIGGGDWRWRWYDHDSGRTLADGVEGDVVAAWRAATTHHVKSSNELLWSLDHRAEAAEQRAEAAERELAQARADARVLACQWRAVDDTEDLRFFGACWREAHPGRSEGDLGRDPAMADLVAALRRALGGAV